MGRQDARRGGRGGASVAMGSSVTSAGQRKVDGRDSPPPPAASICGPAQRGGLCSGGGRSSASSSSGPTPNHPCLEQRGRCDEGRRCSMVDIPPTTCWMLLRHGTCSGVRNGTCRWDHPRDPWRSSSAPTGPTIIQPARRTSPGRTQRAGSGANAPPTASMPPTAAPPRGRMPEWEGEEEGRRGRRALSPSTQSDCSSVPGLSSAPTAASSPSAQSCRQGPPCESVPAAPTLRQPPVSRRSEPVEVVCLRGWWESVVLEYRSPEGSGPCWAPGPGLPPLCFDSDEGQQGSVGREAGQQSDARPAATRRGRAL
eukprot:Hpha_TRINITY_DN15597_c2_g1::TRINITY_DN15597_c2_g1_i1::g.108418::m.108418